MQKYKNVFAYVIEIEGETEHVSNTNDKITSILKHSLKADNHN